MATIFNSTIAAKDLSPAFLNEHYPNLVVVRFGKNWLLIHAREAIISDTIFPLAINEESYSIQAQFFVVFKEEISDKSGILMSYARQSCHERAICQTALNYVTWFYLLNFFAPWTSVHL
jgi:hypothetical protein